MRIDIRQLYACYSLLELGPSELCRRTGQTENGKHVYSERNWGEALRGVRSPGQKINAIAERLGVDYRYLSMALWLYQINSSEEVDEKQISDLD